MQTIVEEQMAHSADLLKVRRVHYIPDIANMLYVDNKLRNTYSSHDSINEMLSFSSSVPGLYFVFKLFVCVEICVNK